MKLKIQKKGSIFHGEDWPLSVCMMETQDPSCRVKGVLASSPTTIPPGPVLWCCPGKVLSLAGCSTRERMAWTCLGNVVELTLTVGTGDRPKGVRAGEMAPPLDGYTTRGSRSCPSSGQCWRCGPGYVGMGELVHGMRMGELARPPQLPQAGELGPPLTWTSRSTVPNGTVHAKWQADQLSYATTQVLIQGFELAHPNIYAI